MNEFWKALGKLFNGFWSFIGRNYMQIGILLSLVCYLFLSDDAESKKMIVGALIAGFNGFSDYMTNRKNDKKGGEKDGE